MYRVLKLRRFAFHVLKFRGSVIRQGQRRHYIYAEGRLESLVNKKAVFILHVNWTNVFIRVHI